jgi:hypothetical protein
MNARREVHAVVDDLTAEQLEEIYGDQAAEVGVKAESLAAADRRLGRVPVVDGEVLDTALVDMQYGDVVAGDDIGQVQGNTAARAEFERQLREAEGTW